MDRIESLRATYEDALMQTDGVVGVGVGHDADGTPRLRIYTSQPVDEVRPRLPDAVAEHAVLSYVGTIDAQ